MAFTMHSHSGQFCPGHAKDQLEDIVKHAISIGYKTMALTEHMPRTAIEDLYPEELTPSPTASLAALAPRHAAFLIEAARLQRLYAPQIHLLIGFEGEWIRPEAYGPLVRGLFAEAPEIDYFIGSVHHAGGGVPIDLDKEHYARARDACRARRGEYLAVPSSSSSSDEPVVENGEDEEDDDEEGEDPEAPLYADYYDAQYAMLQALRPRVVGHFDLIRLLSDSPGRDLRSWQQQKTQSQGRGRGRGKVAASVWPRIVRNLAFVRSYGGWLECNTSALRKGLAEPYPARFIAEEWLKLGGRFTFSDDSHGIAQVATNYARGVDYLESLGVAEVWTFERLVHPGPGPAAEDDGSPAKSPLAEKSVSLAEFRASLKL